MNIQPINEVNVALNMGAQDLRELREKVQRAREEVKTLVNNTLDRVYEINKEVNTLTDAFATSLQNNAAAAVNQVDNQIGALDNLIKAVEAMADPNYMPQMPKVAPLETHDETH